MLNQTLEKIFQIQIPSFYTVRESLCRTEETMNKSQKEIKKSGYSFKLRKEMEGKGKGLNHEQKGRNFRCCCITFLRHQDSIINAIAIAKANWYCNCCFCQRKLHVPHLHLFIHCNVTKTRAMVTNFIM